MYVAFHPGHAALTLIRYDDDTGHVNVKVTGLAEQEPNAESIPLATFLRDVGIPFTATVALPAAPETTEAA